MARRLLSLSRTFTHQNPKLVFSTQIQSQKLDLTCLLKKDLNLEQKQFFSPLGQFRLLSTSGVERSDIDEESSESDNEADGEDFLTKYLNPKDRSRDIPPEVSIKYMESLAYKNTYGDDPIFKHYRRNFKPFHSGRPPLKTRETCIRQGVISAGNPCPICRDRYIIVDYRNTALLNQFLEKYTGKILPPNKTNICQKQWRRMLIAMDKAMDYGLLDLDVPTLHYQLEEYQHKQ